MDEDDYKYDDRIKPDDSLGDFMWEDISAYVRDNNEDGSPGKVNCKYPFNNCTQTESGHLFEMDDTLGFERIRLQHKTGTFTEIAPDGSRVNKIRGKNIEIIEKNNFVHIKGVCNIRVEGNCNLVVNGDLNQRVKGDLNQDIGGNYNMLVRGKIDISSGKRIYMQASDTFGTSGEIVLMAPDQVRIQSELDVDLGVRAESMLSRGFITAGAGIHAGIPVYNPLAALAGISTLGSISAGSSAAPPVPGFVTATVMVAAPIIKGVIVMDLKGPMEFIRVLHNLHKHGETESITTIPDIIM